LLVAYRSDRFLFELPAEIAQHHFEKVGHALAKHHGLAFLMTFDEAQPVEWIGRGEVHWPGTESVPGRFGQARRFDGKPRAHIETMARWPYLGPNFTLSLWIKLEPTEMDQNIWYTAFQGRTIGFKLANGQMTLFVPGGTEVQAAAYPFQSYGRFVHLAAVVESPNGRARLYENGELKAEIPIEAVAHNNHNMEFGKLRWYVVDAPLRGVLDEAAAWKRALSAEEIRALARARQSLPRTLAAFPYWRWRCLHSLQRGAPSLLKTLDRFNPLLHEGRAEAAGLPEIHLHFSQKDARHFIRAHDRSRASGRRTAKGANPRRIHAQYGGATVEAQAWLDGSDTRYASSRRPGYVLETPETRPVFGARRLRLAPPENRDADLARAGAVPSLCRLLINGQFKGIYAFESFDRRGLLPGALAPVAAGPSLRAKWGWLFRAEPADSLRRDADLPPVELKDRLEQAQRLLINDLHHPWSAREWNWRIHRHLARPATPAAGWTSDLSPYALLGRNPSPDYIIENLDLRGLRDLPADIVWTSSRPALIDGRGQVTRPEGGRPVRVELTATRTAEGTSAIRTLSFRVMPRNPKLSALMLYIDEPLTETRQVDFEAVFLPAGGAVPARRLQGHQGAGAGIKFRGNTTYWAGKKKPFSLEFDEPHHLLDGTGTRHLSLLNGQADFTKLKNKFAYDLFRAFARDGHPRHAPEIDWTEVFVNGTYRGVYEMCTRIHGSMLGVAEDPANPEASLLLFRQRAAPKYFFSKPWDDEFSQILPPPRRLRRTDQMLDLLAFTSRADPETFAREAGNRIDLENAIDYLLLINSTGNIDGRTANFYLAREAAPGSLFFIIPYDFDHAFKATTWLSNYLYKRLRRELPGFEDRLRRRWSELRQGPLATAALEARIGELAAHLDGYMDWDLELVGVPPAQTHPDLVEELRQAMRKQLDFVDAQLGGEADTAAQP
jgi:hypothetical protein